MSVFILVGTKRKKGSQERTKAAHPINRFQDIWKNIGGNKRYVRNNVILQSDKKIYGLINLLFSF